MNDEDEFRRFLKRQGKKEHVVDGLVGQVRQFEAHLDRERHTTLAAAGVEDFRAYVAGLQALDPGVARKSARGVGLYFRFTGNAELAGLAGEVREQGIARARHVFRLADFRGVDAGHVARLQAAGIANVEQMLAAGSTPQARHRLAGQADVPLAAILELVKLSDLARIPGLKAIRARLYYLAGADTVERIAAWEPESLHQMLGEFVARTGFDGSAPLPKEVRHTVATARDLPRRVEY